MGLFGGGNSSSSTSNETNNIDQKIQTAAGSTAVSASGGASVVVNQSDFGTVSKAFDFANSIARGAADESAASQAQAASVAKSAMQSVQDAYAGTSDTLAAAYQTAKAGEQKILVAVGVALVAMVALRAVGKGAA